MSGIRLLDLGVFLVAATSPALLMWTVGSLRGIGARLQPIVLIYMGVFALGAAILVHVTRVLHG